MFKSHELTKKLIKKIILNVSNDIIYQISYNKKIKLSKSIKIKFPLFVSKFNVTKNSELDYMLI